MAGSGQDRQGAPPGTTRTIVIVMIVGSVSWCLSESTFLLTLVLVFGAVGILILIVLIVVSQQHR